VKADFLHFMPSPATAADGRASTVVRPQEMRRDIAKRPRLTAAHGRLKPLVLTGGGQCRTSVVKIAGLARRRGATDWQRHNTPNITQKAVYGLAGGIDGRGSRGSKETIRYTHARTLSKRSRD